jgi:hypothetical protein
MHSGYYTNDRGKITDIRAFNYLAALEDSKGNMDVFKPLAAGLEYGSSSEEQLAMSRGALKSKLPHVTITGTVKRIYINPHLIVAMVMMLEECGIRTNTEGLRDFDVHGQRPTMDANFLIPINASSAFSTYQQAQTGRSNPFAGFSGIL